MPEVPQNMQEGIQRMELEAREIVSRRDDHSGTNPQAAAHRRDPDLSTYLHQGPAANMQSPDDESFTPFKDKNDIYSSMPKPDDAPNFSPFPKVHGDNIPPSDEEKEEILYNARQHVLHSNNVSMQLSWARDALNWVEVAMEAHMRENHGKIVRPQTPKAEHELRVDAVNIVSFLASQNHPEAVFMRAKWQEFGKFGFRPEKKEAYLGYKQAADQGWGRAEYRMGMLYENSNDFEKAIKHYNQGLTCKDSAASYRLGMMNLLGQHGHRKDYQRGLDLIQRAADTADEDGPQGAYVYGMLVARDLPDITIPESILPCDFHVARQYIEKAAYLGFAKAQTKMGQAYELCQLGCDFNPALSLHYYGLAARQGQPEAALGVSRWFLFGYEGVFQKNEQLAFKYAAEAADAKLATGEFAMGYYYEIGIHVRKDVREARQWYEKAAEHGNLDAVQRLESLSQSKTLTKQDHETTALTRIKSQHGSQRGKRPERFKQAASAMPTLTESAPTTPTAEQFPNGSRGTSPHPSPGQRGRADGGVDMPDPAHRVVSSPGRPPAFMLNVDNLAMRPKSAAPYPEDDRRAPSSAGRPKSAAPYPSDDMQQGGGHGTGPDGRGRDQFDQRSSSLQPLPPAGTGPRGRVVSGQGWDQQQPAGYRQSGPRDYPPQQGGAPYGRGQPLNPAPAVPAGGDPGRNRLTKNNPNVIPERGYGPATGPINPNPPPQANAYGPRTSSRPVSNVYGGDHPPAGAAPRQTSGGRPIPAPLEDLPRPGPNVASTTATRKPASGGAVKPAAPAASGPATFEAMGIPQGKNDSDCVSPPLLHAIPWPLSTM